MPKESMSPRERWLALLQRQRPDRVPMDYWATDETTLMLMQHLGCGSEREMLAKLHVDYIVKVEPRYAGPPLEADQDVFGCRYRDVDYGSGVYRECITSPMAEFSSVEEIKDRYTWPDPDWWSYDHIPGLIEGCEEHPVQGGLYEPFLIYKQLRGEEQAYMDLLIHPEIVHYCLDELLALSLAEIDRIYEKIPGKVMLTYVAEDMGGQEDLLFSPAHIHEFLLPRIIKVIGRVHQAGAYVFHHNDGSIRRIIPDMITAGIDILNPIQWNTKNMERSGIKRDFGDKVVLHGGMDNQQTLPFGSRDDVRREVLDNLHLLGKDGYILSPCHNIQSITPPENIIEMYETGYAHGWL